MRRTYISGFTVVEVLVYIVMLSLLSSLLYRSIVTMYGASTYTLHRATQVQNTQDSMSRIEQDIVTASRFAASPLAADPALTVGSWAASVTSDNDTLIIEKPATTTLDDTRTLVYLPSLATGCDAATLSGNPHLSYNHIYFIRDNTLWRRTVVPPATLSPRCPGYAPIQKQSCAPAQTAVFCEARDARIVDDVKSFNVEYYTNSNDASPVDVSTDSALIDETISTVKVTVVTTKNIDGEFRDSTAFIRSSRAN